MHTESTEMYLITVYRLTCHAPHATTKDIATLMAVSPPSASEQIKRLTERGYLHHEWREGTTLTPQGKKIAINVLRKHRLAETFLAELAGYALDELHDEACQLEHAMSERLADRLEILLNHPTVDPHGHPIPTKDGSINMPLFQSLADVPVGREVIIQQVSDWDKEALSYLCRMGLTPGVRLKIMEIAPFDGPLTLDVAGRTVALSQTMAAMVGVDEP